jgi:3-oxoacyl-[acyl-carrier-protein] synthase-3
MLQGAIDNIHIAGISVALPKETVNNSNLPFHDIHKTIDSIGVQYRHIAENNICTSDLCFTAAEKLLKDLDWDPASVDCIIVITQTPDYFLPSTAHVLQERLKLVNAMVVFDINLGCSGYVYGLWVISQLLQNKSITRGLLLVGDTISKLTKNNDRATVALFGDAGSATALEKREDKFNRMHFCLGADGTGWKNLIVEKGAFRNLDFYGENPSLFMNGNEIFTFTLKKVPELIGEILAKMEWQLDEVNYFIFHQANAFMLNSLRKKLKITPAQFLLALSSFGNTSSASIPLTLVSNGLNYDNHKMVMAGFGVGYSWGGLAFNWHKDTVVLPVIQI